MVRRVVFVVLSVMAITHGWAQLLPRPQSMSTFREPVVHGKGLRLGTVPRAFRATVQAFTDDWGLVRSGSGRTLSVTLDTSLAEEEYRLRIASTIELRASSPVGVAWGLQTLGQALTKSSREFTIQDSPDAPFRCLMVDVARRYHSPSTLRTLIRWCNAAKVRYLQLHLTDDQNWMLPTEVLKGIDKSNQHGLPAYTREELKDLQAFAAARGVSVTPEIDIPGHSSLITKLDPDVFRIQGSESTNCIDFASPQVRGKMKALLGEITALFPDTPYIHIGGDEAWYPNAERDPDFAAAIKALGEKGSPSQVFVDFVGEMADEVIRLGKTPLVWEGFSASEFAKTRIPKKTVVVAWEGHYYPASKLTDDGFTVVNAGWDPNYVVNHFPYDAYTLVPLGRLYRSEPKRFGIVNWSDPKDASFLFRQPGQVIGSMMCWWEGHEWNAQKFLPARILAFGCGLWNRKGEGDYESFLERSAQVEKAVLGQAHPFAVTLKGERFAGTGQFTESMTVDGRPSSPQLKIAMRTDGKAPQVSDVAPEGSTKVLASCVLSLQAFRGELPVGEVRFIPLFKVEVVSNLALGRPVKVHGADDPQFPAAFLTDGVGDQLSAFWLAYPNPLTATIDLGKPVEINRVQVVAFWATGAPTLYRLDSSLDGRTWEPLADASAQNAPSTQTGYDHRFEKRAARFIRLETLGGALFPPTMTRINDVRVFLDAEI